MKNKETKKVEFSQNAKAKTLKHKDREEFLMYCTDTGKKPDSILENEWLNGQIKLNLKRKPIITRDKKQHFIYVESCIAPMICIDEERLWVWNESLTKLDYFLVYYTKDMLMKYLYMVGTEEELQNLPLSSLLNFLKEYKDEKLLKKLNKIIQSKVVFYEDLVKKAYALEEVMQKLELDVNFFVFHSFYEARALLYVHGQYDINDKSKSFKEMFEEDGDF